MDHQEAYTDLVLPAFSNTDSNQDGLDDAFDNEFGGLDAALPDTDEDGTPDYFDLDADGDGISDYTEACPSPPATCPIASNEDTDGDAVTEVTPTISDGSTCEGGDIQIMAAFVKVHLYNYRPIRSRKPTTNGGY